MNDEIEISIEVKINGKQYKVEFIRPEKVKSLLKSDESLGSFLSDIVKQAKE